MGCFVSWNSIVRQNKPSFENSNPNLRDLGDLGKAFFHQVAKTTLERNG